MSKTPDEIKYHILSVIYSLSKSYNLTLDDIAHHTYYIESIDPEKIKHTYDEYINYLENETKEYSQQDNDSTKTDSIHSNYEVDAQSDNDAYESEHGSYDEGNTKDNSLIYISSRREFKRILSDGVKICPRYSSCTDTNCINFHVSPENLCPHNPRGSYCEHDDCDLIVIKPCRRGKRCNDPKCSFRH